MKISKEMQFRNDGILFALNYAKEHGIEELEKEVKRRGCLPALPKDICRELDRFTDTIKDNCVDTVLLMAIYTLRDEFKFGHDRLERFKKVYVEKTENLCEGWYDWVELTEMLKDECNLNLTLKHPEDFEQIRRTRE